MKKRVPAQGGHSPTPTWPNAGVSLGNNNGRRNRIGRLICYNFYLIKKISKMQILILNTRFLEHLRFGHTNGKQW
ncbi:hypothetical protein HUG15_10420 [Salicibibacter cibarius]|uniref:Uncharacterized protein n=1 Tax=Salicibibacter cibarius TaxID=2743000 RepID=A0A7T6Z2W1_9BACI|nr:hypothetical protein [Salicibibacter cibarius]QQK75931.1 hypothetical protein HUG15_10420 [Salicibibacter cibarius]